MGTSDGNCFLEVFIITIETLRNRNLKICISTSQPIDIGTSYCWARASSRNERACIVIPTRAQSSVENSPTPLNCFAGLCKFSRNVFRHCKTRGKFNIKFLSCFCIISEVRDGLWNHFLCLRTWEAMICQTNIATTAFFNIHKHNRGLLTRNIRKNDIMVYVLSELVSGPGINMDLDKNFARSA